MPQHTAINQGTILDLYQDAHLLTWIEAFLVDRKAQGLSQGILYSYRNMLNRFPLSIDGLIVTKIKELGLNQL